MILDTLKKMFGGGNPPAPAAQDNSHRPEKINFITIDAKDLPVQYPHALQDLFEAKLHGFLVKNFLSPPEVKTLLEAHSQLTAEELTHTPVGHFFPQVFPEFSRAHTTATDEQKPAVADAYFEFNEQVQNNFEKRFGVDLYARFKSFFESIASQRPVESPAGFGGRGRYAFGTFRNFIPGKGFLAIHCGNYFQTLYEPVYKHLMQEVKVKNQMSFFVMLQRADEGGNLTVFNLRWQDGMSKTEMMNDVEVILPDGRKVYPDTDEGFQKQDMKPQPGDVILFQGGNIWHRVSNVEGSKPRITFGGFISPDHAEKKFYFWA